MLISKNGGGGRYRGGGGFRLPVALLPFLSILASLLFLTARDRRDFSNISSKPIVVWREHLAVHHLKSIFFGDFLKSNLTEEAICTTSASRHDVGQLIPESARKNYLSSSWKIDGFDDDAGNNVTSDPIRAASDVELKSSQIRSENIATLGAPLTADKGLKDGEQLLDTPAKVARRQLRALIPEKMTIELIPEKMAIEQIQQDDEALVKLENAAFEHSTDVDSAVQGKYSIWKRENEIANSDSKVRLMHNQMIMARVYAVIAKSKNKLDLYQELLTRLKESHQALGEAIADYDLHISAPLRIKAMGQVLSKAGEQLYDCEEVMQQIRMMLQSAEEHIRAVKKQNMYLIQSAAKMIPNGINCLSMRLSIAYYLLPQEERNFPRSENLENPNLYHFALFSDNVMAASVVVNSTIMNAKEPEKHVFHLVTDTQNFGAMSMWFLLNPPGNATIHVENVDDFKWLNSSYCPVLRQLESAAMKDLYFKANHPTARLYGSNNLKYRNPKYLSIMNHLRFYLPQLYPRLDKILFLDDDTVVQKDLTALWSVDLKGSVNGAVETCGASFHRFDKYLNFSNPHISRNVDRNACGWAFGMNIFDLVQWKKKDLTGVYHRWQTLNEGRTLWSLGTLPAGLLTFYRLTHPLERSLHVLGLGYDPSIGSSEIENAAVIHYNGNMKPWLELGMGKFRPYWTKYVKYDHSYVRSCNLSE